MDCYIAFSWFYMIKSERGDIRISFSQAYKIQVWGKLGSKLESLINPKKKMLRHLLIKKVRKNSLWPLVFYKHQKIF